MKWILFTLVCLSTAWAHPDLETHMATVTSNIDTDTGRFYLVTEANGDIDAIRYTITARSGTTNEDQTHTWERIRDGGIVLVHREGREILRLFIDKNFSPVTGGVVRINYLYSGVSNSRRDLLLNLVRTGETFALRRETTNINTLYIQGNWHVLLGLIGISTITPSWKAPLVYADSPSFE